MTDTKKSRAGSDLAVAAAAVVIFLGLAVGLLGVQPDLAVAASAPADTLVLVNGDPVTASDLDEMIMEAHRSMDMTEEGSGVVDRLLNKGINDLLIVQDALAAGMDTEPELVSLIDGRRKSYAIREYVRDNLQLPTTPPEDEVQAFFEKYYWQIQLRRISVRTEQEALDLKMAVMAGADMDSLAHELSLDTKKPSGGLYNLLYWADLENRIRDRVFGLEVGAYSDVFPYNDAFTFLRVERIIPVDPASFDVLEAVINPQVLQIHNQELWDAFVDGLIANYELEESMSGFAAIMADSAKVLTGDFLKEDPTAVIQLEGGQAVTGTELRKAISHEVMQNAMAPFGENLATARRKETSELVLSHAAYLAGYFESPSVEKLVAKDLEQALIETYLADTVASRISFNREEFDEFYEENKEKFRGPEEVRIDILILENEAEAQDAARRLAEGADFGFIFGEYYPGQEATLGQSKFIKRDQLSRAFRDQLANMEEGDTSQPVEISAGWVIIKLAEVKEGTLATMDEVEMEIRKVIYQRKFNALLDEHLTLLKDNSEIIRFEDNIEAYILSGEDGS